MAKKKKRKKSKKSKSVRSAHMPLSRLKHNLGRIQQALLKHPENK